MGNAVTCFAYPTPVQVAAEALQKLVSLGIVDIDEIHQLKDDFKNMDSDNDGFISTRDAAVAQIPPKVWRGILAAATADLANAPTKLSFAEYALLSLSHKGNREAERELLLVRAGCAFDSISERPKIKEGVILPKDKQGYPIYPKPTGRIRRKDTLDRSELWAACRLLGELQGGTEYDVGPKIAGLGRIRRGRMARSEFLKMVLMEHPVLNVLPPLKGVPMTLNRLKQFTSQRVGKRGNTRTILSSAVAPHSDEDDDMLTAKNKSRLERLQSENRLARGGTSSGSEGPVSEPEQRAADGSPMLGARQAPVMAMMATSPVTSPTTAGGANVALPIAPSFRSSPAGPLPSAQQRPADMGGRTTR